MRFLLSYNKNISFSIDCLRLPLLFNGMFSSFPSCFLQLFFFLNFFIYAVSAAQPVKLAQHIRFHVRHTRAAKKDAKENFSRLVEYTSATIQVKREENEQRKVASIRNWHKYFTTSDCSRAPTEYTHMFLLSIFLAVHPYIH